jgi:zinc protease
VIRRFFTDWYRPDLQALIIVGDIDVAEAEKLVKAKFADLKTPAKLRERTVYNIALTGKQQFMAVTDKEQANASIEVMMKHYAPEVKTEQDYLAQIKRGLFNQLINTRRYAETSRESNAAYTGMGAGINGFIGNVDMFSFNVSAKEGRLQQSFEQTWLILERIKRYGFSQDELDRAKQNQLRNLETSVKEKTKTSSVSYVNEYKSLFLKGEASPGIEWEYQFTKNNIANISLADINALMNEYLASKDVDILVIAPEKDKSTLPDSATVYGWINILSKADVTPFKDEQVNSPLLAVKPKPGKVIKKQEIAKIGVTRLMLSNGINVILKPTDFKNDRIVYGAYGPGGTSLYDNADYDVAANTGGLIGRFGLGDLNPVQLSKVLTGKVAGSTANIGPRSQTINGSASPQDLETALQITYLQFTAPRKDTVLFKSTMSNAIEGLNNRYADPNRVFADTISNVMGNYSYRSAPPTAERLEKITLQRAYDIYKERFADASGFTFVFVGNFKTDSITPLLETYLGSLPSLNKNIKARDLGIHIPYGQMMKKVYKGTENKATVRLLISGDYKYSALENLHLKAIGEVLQIKVLQQLRENAAEVYSPQVQSVYNKYPKNRYAIIVQFGCAPQSVDHLIGLVKQEMQDLCEKGPELEDVQKFKAQYLNNYELALKDNGFWYGYLLGQYENNEDVLQVLDTKQNLDKINQASLKKSAQVFLSGKNLITFELLPESVLN